MNPPIEVLPKFHRTYAHKAGEAAEIQDKGMILLNFLCTQSIIYGGKVRVLCGNIESPTNVCAVSGAETGSRKSAIHGMIAGQFIQIAKEWLTEWTTKGRLDLEVELIECERVISDAGNPKAASAPTDEELGKARIRKREIADELKTIPALWIGDITMPRLETYLMRNGERMAIIDDDARMFLATMAGKYNDGEPDLQAVLKGWDGGQIRASRAEREIILNSVFLVLNLSIAIEGFHKFIFNKSIRNSGAHSRFLLYQNNERTPDVNFRAPKMSQDLQQAYRALLKGNMDLFFEQEDTAIVPFAENAVDAAQDWAQGVTERLRGGLSDMVGTGVRWHINLIRVAFLLRAMRRDSDYYFFLKRKDDWTKNRGNEGLEFPELEPADLVNSKIELQDIQGAIKIMDWQIHNQLEIFNFQRVEDADPIWKAIQKLLKTGNGKFSQAQAGKNSTMRTIFKNLGGVSGMKKALQNFVGFRKLVIEKTTAVNGNEQIWYVERTAETKVEPKKSKGPVSDNDGGPETESEVETICAKMMGVDKPQKPQRTVERQADGFYYDTTAEPEDKATAAAAALLASSPEWGD